MNPSTRRRRLRHLIANGHIRLGYFLFLFILIIWCAIKRYNNVYKKTTLNFNYVTVHIDLKGSPPKLKYLAYLLPIFRDYGVNSILMEYEDMFPFRRKIANLSAQSCYKSEELKEFLTLAHRLHIEVIPLVQTFGHMEYALKLREFMHLREENMFPDSICPSNPESIELIKDMLKQILNFHNSIARVKHIHVGADEVHKINLCKKCKSMKKEPTQLFLNHVNKVHGIVKQLSPATDVLIWHDMLKYNKISDTKLVPNVETVLWDYTSDRSLVTPLIMYNFHKKFNNLWIATAYKGADGATSVIPNITQRFHNHLVWMRTMLEEKSNNRHYKGIILTGWSRYTHMHPQCELLPTAIPSLILNLLLIKTVTEGVDPNDLKTMDYCDFYNKYLEKDFIKIFECRQSSTLCSFENTVVYEENQKLLNINTYFPMQHIDYMYSCQDNRLIDMPVMLKVISKIKYGISKCALKEKELRTFMKKYYDYTVIQSYVYERFHIYVNEAKRILNILEKCVKIHFWQPRP